MKSAQKLIQQIIKRDFNFPSNLLSKDMQKLFNLENTMIALEKQFGKLESLSSWEEHNKRKQGEYTEYVVLSSFSTAKFNFVVSVKEEDDIIYGVRIEPYFKIKELKEEKESELFDVIDCKIGEEPWKLNAKLTIPKNKGSKFNALILVHGSGPNDMDETIGPNKPFKQIAEHLASKGIAVLRYNKRTREYQTKLDPFSLTGYEETIEDAYFAYKYLEFESNINKIFVLGHSLGGYFLPRIADEIDRRSENKSKIGGFISMNGSNSKLEDLVLQQMNYILPDKEKLVEIEKQAQKIKNLDFEEGELIIGGSKAYYEYLSKYDPLKECERISKSHHFLFLQGEADYQVLFDVDFKRWINLQSQDNKLQCKSFPYLNHLMYNPPEVPRSSKLSTPMEYHVPSEFDQDVLKSIEVFIEEKSK